MHMTSEAWQRAVEVKLDRVLNDLDFIKNRTAVYLGRNEVLTYLVDETPIFVNSDDCGCPLNFINGGMYEEDYFKVFLSFRSPRLPMLDVGANLGVFSLRMASHMRNGAIHAFEPIPRIRNLFARSSFLNGFADRIHIHPFAVSDQTGTAMLQVPSEHAGGASLDASPAAAGAIAVETRKLDDLFPQPFTCGLVKLDVEGHELHALRGMRALLSRSENCAVMFEKLAANSGIEGAVSEFFSELGWKIYEIDGRTLRQVSVDRFAASGGYFIAAAEQHVMGEGLNRDCFRIFPTDLNVIEGVIENDVLVSTVSGRRGAVLFHGPYWGISRGYYRLSIDGEVSGRATLDICEKFGFKVTELVVESGKLSVEFPVYRDLAKFEIVMRPKDDSYLAVKVNSIKLTRLG